METVVLPPERASVMGVQAARVQAAAAELANFGETEPTLAGQCGVEVLALEARTLLAGGAPERVGRGAEESVQRQLPLHVARRDIDALSRLEGVVSLGSSRIGIHMASLEAAEKQSKFDQVGALIGLAGGAVGLIKSFM